MKKAIKFTVIGLGGLLTSLSVIHYIKLRKIHKTVTEELVSQ